MDFAKISQAISAFVTAAQPMVDGAVGVFAPELSAGVSIGEKLIQGVLAEVPSAVTLVDQIASGTDLTAEQVAGFEADYEAAYQKTKADLAAAIAAATAAAKG